MGGDVTWPRGGGIPAEMSTQCWFIVGPASQTLAQQ